MAGSAPRSIHRTPTGGGELEVQPPAEQPPPPPRSNKSRARYEAQVPGRSPYATEPKLPQVLRMKTVVNDPYLGRTIIFLT